MPALCLGACGWLVPTAWTQEGWASRCGGALPEARKEALAAYVVRRYSIPKSVAVTVTKEALVGGSCYRELTFEGKNSFKSWQQSLYLSPDGRYLSAEIFDTTVDPVAEARQKAATLMGALAQNRGTSKGNPTAPVTIVEFSDFQCPYCKKLAETVDQLSPDERAKVRVVFHHLPLPMHVWARPAAEAAACAQLQGPEVFWALHDELFANQEKLDQNSFKPMILGLARSTKGLDVPKFQECTENQLSLGLVLRDMNLASLNDINSTPTLFINGHRVSGIRDKGQLIDLIHEAEKEADSEATAMK